jgi:hypothetical protein
MLPAAARLNQPNTNTLRPQLAFEEALLRERLKFVRELKEQLQDEEGMVAQTVKAYTAVVDGEPA